MDLWNLHLEQKYLEISVKFCIQQTVGDTGGSGEEDKAKETPKLYKFANASKLILVLYQG